MKVNEPHVEGWDPAGARFRALRDLLEATYAVLAQGPIEPALGRLSQAMQNVSSIFPQVAMRNPAKVADPAVIEAGLLFLEFAGSAVVRIASHLRTGKRDQSISGAGIAHGALDGALAGVFAALDVLTENGFTTEDTIRERAVGVFHWMRQHVKHALVPTELTTEVAEDPTPPPDAKET